MVLIDTSLWVRYLANRTPSAAELERLLDSGEVVRHDLVHGELLIGDPGGRILFLRTYELIRRVPNVPHPEVAALVRTRKLFGRGIDWIDAHLLASALASGTPLWTADRRLAGIAEELGIAYVPVS